MQRLQSWPDHEFLNMKREWNQSADQLASSALQQDTGTVVISDSERQDLVSLNRLDELIVPNRPDQVVKMATITRSTSRSRGRPQVICDEVVQQIRIERIKQAQEEEGWIANLKNFLVGSVTQMSEEDAKCILGLLQIMKWTRTACYFSVPERRGLWEIEQRSFASWYRSCCNTIFCIIITRVWKKATKGSEGRTSVFDPISIGEGCIGASNIMWVSV